MNYWEQSTQIHGHMYEPHQPQWRMQVGNKSSDMDESATGISWSEIGLHWPIFDPPLSCYGLRGGTWRQFQQRAKSGSDRARRVWLWCIQLRALALAIYSCCGLVAFSGSQVPDAVRAQIETPAPVSLCNMYFFCWAYRRIYRVSASLVGPAEMQYLG